MTSPAGLVVCPRSPGRTARDTHDAADNYRAEENLLRDLAAAVRNNLAEYSKTGIYHGDVSLDNI